MLKEKKLSSIIIQNSFNLCGIVIIQSFSSSKLKTAEETLTELEFGSREICHPAQVSFEALYFLDVSFLEARGCKNANCISAFASTC